MATKILESGLPGLDNILRGGFKPATVVIVEGLPGTGKTLLASEMAARSKQRTLYLSFEISRDFFYECCESFQWAVSPDFVFSEVEELDVVALQKKIEDLKIERVVIDSLTPTKLQFEGRPQREYRAFLQNLFRTLKSLNVLTVCITETSPSRLLGETGAGPEHFLADTVITLRKDESRRSLLRSLEVAKSRGQNALLGRHSFRILDSVGVQVFPRAYSRQRMTTMRAFSDEKVTFGIPGLEAMLGGGVFKGSTTLLVGISGTGKTVTGMQFLNEGLKNGESCLLVSMDDSKEQFCKQASQLGFHFSEAVQTGQLAIFHEMPVEIELDAHFWEIQKIVRERKCTRVVIDSVSTYEKLLPKECHEFLIALSAFLKNEGATSVLALESNELLGLSHISVNLRASGLADNIVLMNYVEISTTLRRAITVPKTRGGKPDHQTREYVIKAGGLAILDESSVPASDKVPQLPLSSYYGVLARSPTRHSPIIDESVAAGKPMPKSKIPKPLKTSASPAN